MRTSSRRATTPSHDRHTHVRWLTATIYCVGAFTTAQGASGNERNPQDLEEVIVTAQKQAQRLQDVPVPVSIVNTAALVDSEQLRLKDYYTRVPGLNLTLIGDGSSPQVAIRGITTGGFANPTVAMVIDDVPYGSSTSTASSSMPDIDPSDLARVEVLRGPQGTLYGASSLGGLIKFVTVDPSMDQVTGRLQMGSAGVENGDGVGFNVRGSINLPLSDTFALRASAFTRREPGYVDNVQTGKDGVNRVDAEGGQLTTLWRPTDGFSLKLSALLQHNESLGSPQVHRLPGLGDLEQRALPDTGGYDHKVQAYSATLSADLGSTELTSLSGYSINEMTTRFDGTAQLGALSQARFGVPGAISVIPYKVTKFSQELRLAVPFGTRADWLVGAFYTREKIPFDQNILATQLTSAPVGSLFHITGPFEFEEYAGFTNLTLHFTDRFDLQIGARAGRDKREDGPTVTTSMLAGPIETTTLAPQVTSEEDAYTFLLTPQWKLSRDLMVYVRLASGYRPGGPNANAAVLSGAGLPVQYDADKTQNYEIGVKGAAFDSALSFDASVYQIDWDDIQLQLRDPVSGFPYLGNGSKARSRGVELSSEVRPASGLSLAGWVAWNDAELTETIPPGPVVGADGSRLPYSTRFSGSLSVDQEFPLGSSMTGFVGATASYVGDRVGVFRAVAQRQTFPSYSQVDLRAGIKYESWSVSAFVSNLADKRGELRGGLDRPAALAYSFDYIRPRAFGLSLTKTF